MVNLINEFRDITKRAKLTERLFTLYELRNILNEKINKTEAKIVELDMEIAKDENKRDSADGSDKK
jgi:hypothetical protein